MDADRELVEIDMLGQVCPSTLLTALREINARADALRAGKVELLFRTDNRACTLTIPESASNMGYNCRVEKAQGIYLIRICRGEGDAAL